MFFAVIAIGALTSANTPSTAAPSAVRLADFTRRGVAWVAVNDGVMGGVSSGTTAISDAGYLRFVGRVRLENNGGFASARSARLGATELGALAVGKEIVARVRGDGRRYQLTMRGTRAWFWATIEPPPGEWVELHLPFASFTPHSRFGDVLETGTYNGEPIDSVGVLIYNKRAESFRFDVAWLEVR